MLDLLRFMEKVEIVSDCWLWNASTKDEAYGGFYYEGKIQFAHRVSYKFFKGDIGDKQVHHTCDTPLCVNPKHLWLGTHADNMRDRQQKGRARGLFEQGYDGRRCKQRDPITGRMASNA